MGVTAISRIMDFWRHGIWTMRLNGLSPARAYSIRCLRVLILAVRGFIKDDCEKAASLLTYYSLLNIVPLFAMVFAVAKGFGLERLIRQQILDMAQKANWQAELTGQLLKFSSALLQQTRGGLIAGVGIILLFWTVISIMGKIEETFNAIWDVSKPRTLARKLSDYIAIIAFAPPLFAISNSVTILAAGKIGGIIRAYAPPGGFVTFAFVLLGLLPYLSVWALLVVLYRAMPNTRVPLRSCLVGAVAAGTVFQVVQWAYIKFQIGVSSYGAIYGSFAALPLFLVWLQTSWRIILFGAEIAHADEHYETFGFEPDYTGISSSSRKLLMLRVMHLLVRRFSEGSKPSDTADITRSLEVPLPLVKEALSDLTASGLAVQVIGKSGDAAMFQPGKSVEMITISGVLDAYEQRGKTLPTAARSPEAEQISARLKEISDAVEKSKGNVSLGDIR